MTPISNRAPTSKKTIAAIAEKIKVSLPADFVEFYIKYNGGKFEEGTFTHTDDELRIQEFLSFGSGADSIEETYNDVFVENDLTPNNILPFAADSSGDYFCISVTQGNFGEVVFFDSENYDSPERCIIRLAPSFHEFLTRLKSS